MPSGQRIAATMGLPVLDSDHFPELRTYNLGLDASTPLWYYVLREASVFAGAAHLGPVGGRIAAETISGYSSSIRRPTSTPVSGRPCPARRPAPSPSQTCSAGPK